MSKRTTDIDLYLRLLRYVRPYWRMFLISIISMVILAATDPAVAALIKPMLDGAFIENDPQTMILVPILFVVLFTVRGIATFASGAALHWVASKVIMDLRVEMFQRLITLPGTFYDHHATGTLISKFTFDVTQIQHAATNAITVAIRDTLAIIGLLAWMFYINWKLSLISLVCAPFIMLIVVVIRKRLRRMGRRMQESMGDINNVLGESIHNHKLIKLYGGQTQEAERFWNASDNSRRFFMKYAIAAVTSSPAIQLIAAIALSAIVYIASLQATSGALTVGEFISFFAAMTMLMTPLKRLVGINEFIQKGLAACESIFGLLDQPAEIDQGTRQIERAKGAIELQDLSFRYNPDDSDALSHISFAISPGETVALVGPSGSGKTTMANLLPGFYHNEQGHILIDGTDIREYKLESLRANIAFVTQEVVLFNDTIRNNIAYGAMRNCSDGELEAAAGSAHALEFIIELPDGLNTVIGERGLRLSGGQRQRLAIARALLKNAPILILDEATSSLDTESERHIQAALETLRKGRTCIIIAHRLSTIENADRIIVIEHGKIVQTGTHAELIKKDGLYARLHKVQFSESP
jgi:subfamily B ATP-binding cassette protein MsbA